MGCIYLLLFLSEFIIHLIQEFHFGLKWGGLRVTVFEFLVKRSFWWELKYLHLSIVKQALSVSFNAVFSFLFSFCIIILRFMFMWENVWNIFTGMSQVLWHGVENNFNQPISWENVTISWVTVILYEFVQCH